MQVSAGDSGLLRLGLLDFLGAAAKAIDALPFDANDLLTRLDELRERFVERRFHRAVLGQFKRGKSTLINALLGEEVLPSAVVPLTAIPTMILAGRERAARVAYLDGSPDRLHRSLSPIALLAVAQSLVTETGNPANTRRCAICAVGRSARNRGRGGVSRCGRPCGRTHLHRDEQTGLP